MEEISFSAYKNVSASSVSDIIDNIENKTPSKPTKSNFENNVDERLFKYKLGKDETCSIKIRFLPTKNIKRPPIVANYKHNYNNPTSRRFLDEYCLKSLGKDTKCPICDDKNRYYYDQELQKQIGSISEAEDIGSKHSKRAVYTSCIYIIDDNTNPDNNGKVFIWNYGPAVYKIISSAIKPSEVALAKGEKPITPFHLINGATFFLSLKKVDKRVTYEDCGFGTPSPLFDNDDELKKVWDKIYDLSEFDAEKVCKSFGYLKHKVDFVNGTTNTYKYDENAIEEQPLAKEKEIPIPESTPDKSDDVKEEEVKAETKDDTPKQEAKVDTPKESNDDFNDWFEN